MNTSTATTLATIVALQDGFETGRVERRMVAYFFEGLKYDLYDMVSLRLGRNSREAETCKNEIRQIIGKVKKVCYELVNSEIEGIFRLDGRALTGIVGYVMPMPRISDGALWQQLDKLIVFTFKDKAVVKFIMDRVYEYAQDRIPKIVTQYDEQRAGAIDYIRKHINGQNDD